MTFCGRQCIIDTDLIHVHVAWHMLSQMYEQQSLLHNICEQLCSAPHDNQFVQAAIYGVMIILQPVHTYMYN